MRDIFFIDTNNAYSQKNWEILKSKRLYAKRLRVKQETFAEIVEKVSKMALTQSFWIIYDNVSLINNFDFEYSLPNWDALYVHRWYQVYLKTGKSKYGGVYLLDKHHNLDIQFKDVKQVSGAVKEHPAFDIFFISYNEPQADENYSKVVERYPNAKRISGVTGIHNAHLAAAKQATTSLFWVIDADAVLLPAFELDMQIDPWDKYDVNRVYTWRSMNPVNNLVYGYGGVKLLPTSNVLSMDTSTVDMTTSISGHFKPMSQVSNYTMFNVDPFNTWKSAFRECVKLSSKVIDKQKDDDTEQRLNVWCTAGTDQQYGHYCIAGANAGREYGIANRGNVDALKKINDFAWLYEQFSKYTVE